MLGMQHLSADDDVCYYLTLSAASTAGLPGSRTCTHSVYSARHACTTLWDRTLQMVVVQQKLMLLSENYSR